MLRQSRVLVGAEGGWPFYEVTVGYGVHHRVQLELAWRGLGRWNYGGYAGLKIGVMQNRERSAGIAVRLLAGYRRIISESGLIYRQLGGGDGAFGELWLLGSVRLGRHALLVDGGVRVSHVSECLSWDRAPGTDRICPSDPFENGETGLFITAFTEAGWEVRLSRNFSLLHTLGVDLFVIGGVLWPAMIRTRLAVVADF